MLSKVQFDDPAEEETPPATLRNRYQESTKSRPLCVSRIEPFAKSQPTKRLVGSFLLTEALHQHQVATHLN
jgi:hypothetical protein